MEQHEEITYEWSGVLDARHGLTEQDLTDLLPRLEASRKEVLDDRQLWRQLQEGNAALPAEKDPLDAYFFPLPEELLGDNDGSGQLSRIKATADEVASCVDRVVVLGIGGSYMGARALFEACCHTYFDQLSRENRNGRPRLYFAGNNVDNDALQDLLDLLRADSFSDPTSRWALVVISKSGGTLETAVAFRELLELLQQKCVGQEQLLPSLVVPITGTGSRLHRLCEALNCPDERTFPVPEGVGGRFSILSAVGLLPAAMVGLDVELLLRGAAAMNERFRQAPPGENPVLDYVAVCHLMESLRGAKTRVLAAWSNKLEAVGLWYDQLLAESLGKEKSENGDTIHYGALPLTMVNTRDLHSRHQQHQQGHRDKLITNLIVQGGQRPPLVIENSELNQDQLNDYAGATLPRLMEAAIQGTNQALRDDHRPTANLYLPVLDEGAIGQLLQMLMLATAVEGRLLGINPYGQPGVEGYKQNMQRILKGT